MTAPPSLRRHVGFVVATGAFAGAVMLALGIGWLAPHRPLYAVLVGAAVLALGVSLLEPAMLPFGAVCCAVLALRVGGATLDFTVADAALGLATLPALVLAIRPLSPPMRSLLWLTTAYLALTSFTLIANPYRANAVEWVHQGVLVGGALIVGWAV
ncbi:MAG: hypothetical protein ABI187_06800, partial [Ornithinibacter sp.]